MKAAAAVTSFATWMQATAMDARWAPVLALRNITEILARTGSDGKASLAVDYGNSETTEFFDCDNMPLDGVVFPEGLLRLKLHSFKLRAIPPDYLFPSTVDTIEFPDNDIPALSASIQWPTALRTLDLSRNKIQSIDSSLAWPSALTHLDLSTNKLSSFPTPKWPDALEFLSLAGNPVGNVPPNQAWPASLARLLLANANLNVFPSSLPLNLKQISLSNNALPTFPQPNQLPASIEDIDLGGTGLTSVPSKIEWPHATTLWLGDNAITSLPDDFSVPSSLWDINLANNKITHLPESGAWLASLKSLNLENNVLTSIPEGTTLPSESTVLRGNRITALKKIALSRMFNIEENPLRVISLVTFPPQSYWTTGSIELTEFTLSDAMFQRFKKTTQETFFHPQFTTNPSAVHATCDAQGGDVKSLGGSITVCVVGPPTELHDIHPFI
ncbi:Aste57867_3672 [Aphanomyces stellatus]|uniref:Aste57867_3672 protein n=1 Tax=Aphanomyces stellatus TaxID=120398 RepID=A0A485KA47_9STRA|nr:hypothetical protein As57867_003661 [Aphanomyces stellatus]VFT80827.1 Aste57867_3672 [Aphanomyces stellatus]